MNVKNLTVCATALVLVLLLLLQSPNWAAVPGADGSLQILNQEKSVLFRARNVPLKDIVVGIFREFQVRIDGLKSREDEPITFFMEGQPLQEVIKGLLRCLGENNYAFESIGDRLRRVSVFPKGSMGVYMRPDNEIFEPEKPKTEGPKRVEIVEVTNVIEGSQAESLGLQKGDFIVEYDGKKMGRASQLVLETKKKNPHETVELRVVREGNPMRYFVNGGFIGIQVKTVKVLENSINY